MGQAKSKRLAALKSGEHDLSIFKNPEVREAVRQHLIRKGVKAVTK